MFTYRKQGHSDCGRKGRGSASPLRHILMIAALFLVGGLPGLHGREVRADETTAEVSVQDSGSQPGEASQGRKTESRVMTLDNGAIRYGFRYCYCVDPLHPDNHVCDEGYFGMPVPSACNWYHSGFMFISVNGKDLGNCPLSDMRSIETGARGTFQMVWDHPDAAVQLRVMLPAKANHVITDLTWKPKPNAAVNSITLRLVCYPSYFTAWNHRQGGRHCETPRINKSQPETLDLEPDKDTYLYYYDTNFDVANGEGEGPCAMMFTGKSIKSGRVSIGDYAIMTDLVVDTESKGVRMAFYDFVGKKNAEAAAYLKTHGAEDQTLLAQTSFRPEQVARLNIGQLRADTQKYLKEAGEDGKPYQKKLEDLVARITDLKKRADEGDGKAEAEVSSVLSEYQTLFWKLKILALLNG